MTALARSEARAARWDSEFIPCSKHLDRRCLRSQFVYDRRRCCSRCHHPATKTGALLPSHRRYDASEQGRWIQRSSPRACKIKEHAI